MALSGNRFGAYLMVGPKSKSGMDDFNSPLAAYGPGFPSSDPPTIRRTPARGLSKDGLVSVDARVLE